MSLFQVGNRCYSHAEEPESDAYAQKLCKAEGKQVAGGKQVANNAYICSKTSTMQMIGFLLAKDSNATGQGRTRFKCIWARTNNSQMQLGKDKQEKQQAEGTGAYQGCQHSVAVVESMHEVAVHVERGMMCSPATM